MSDRRSIRYVAASLGAVLDALGAPTRRAILDPLSDDPRAVGALADELPVSRSAVSQHLRVLRDAELAIEEAAEPATCSGSTVRGSRLRVSYTDRLWQGAPDDSAAAGRNETPNPGR